MKISGKIANEMLILIFVELTYLVKYSFKSLYRACQKSSP